MIEPSQQPLVYAAYPDLAGKRVVVTGGDSVLGRELVSAFARQGARVWFFGLEGGAERAQAAAPESAVQRPRPVVCDPAHPASVRAAFALVEEEAGAVDILLNNGGDAGHLAPETASAAAWDDWVATDLRHKFFCCQAVLPGMTRQGSGVILNIGAMPAVAGTSPNMTAAADEGLVGLTRSIARDLGRWRVRATTVLPGAMTAPWDGLAPAAVPAAVGIEDVAALALFLASSNGRCCRGPE